MPAKLLLRIVRVKQKIYLDNIVAPVYLFLNENNDDGNVPKLNIQKVSRHRPDISLIKDDN